MSLKNFLFILLIFFSAQSYAQKQKKLKPRDKARADIVMLKGGALLVRLKTSELKINGLKNLGLIKEAEAVRVAQENTNKQIVEAFWKEFHFCKVYFFYSNHSNQIKTGNHKGYLMNVNMEIDSSFTGQSYLTGEFGESETTGMDAFIMMDKNFDQMNKPFPYMVKLNQALVSTRPYTAVIAILNEKLFDFYR